MHPAALATLASLLCAQQGGHHVRVPGETASAFHRYSLRPAPRGLSTVDVVGPRGAHADVFLGNQRQMSEPLPLHFRAVPDRTYTVVVRLAPELTFQQEIATRDGMHGTLEVLAVCPCAAEPEPPRPPPRAEPPEPTPPVPPPAPAPTAMPEPRFRALIAAMKAESFEDKKLVPLRSAAAHHFFSCDQVGELVDLFSFRPGRLAVIKAVRGRVADPENLFQVYQHFHFSTEKEEAERLLAE
ncbi:MAG: DUF4476 domain-containing protein [Deltaproteobacteria bacterium]|nr:DUF4476 domain-containing protein [Deltaproteobacteria bacterium]